MSQGTLPLKSRSSKSRSPKPKKARKSRAKAGPGGRVTVREHVRKRTAKLPPRTAKGRFKKK